jgi:hypothetical protein
VTVRLYALVLVVSLVVGVVSWRRSGGSMIRYELYTGAPVVWLLLAGTAVSAIAAEAAGDPALATELFTGGLIGTGLAQVVLLRRGVGGPPGDDRG